MISLTRLSDVFVEVADTLVADFDLVDFLHTVARHAAQITDSSAVGLMLSDQDGRLRYMAASSEDARLLELFQIQHAEGPCLDCHRSGEEIVHTDLAAAERTWPIFAPRAVALGFGSVHAFPMRLRDQVIGAMNVFRSDSTGLGPDEVRVAQALVDVATIALMQERAITRAEALTEQLQGALNSRIVIEQAKGAVARTFEIGVDEAFELLRDHARHHQRRLTDLARSLVNDTSLIATLRESPDPRVG